MHDTVNGLHNLFLPYRDQLHEAFNFGLHGDAMILNCDGGGSAFGASITIDPAFSLHGPTLNVVYFCVGVIVATWSRLGIKAAIFGICFDKFARPLFPELANRSAA